ncbi:[LysW]-lysine hydrolase [Halorussus marinus]|uniref:[LysW]-lysine hydrolase n=1 Tax=Halorussus marinus TaxID=2505976 RepID=UPI00109196E9|nr:[LysW]-lysine hydrolase [Halorussus marinus]
MSAGAVATDGTARDLLADLVAIPSPSGEEGEAARRLAAFFEERDREVWIDEVGNVRAPADDAALLTSHVDTVPGEIPVRIEETDDGREELWGRGSVDATGPLAAMAVAAVRTGVSFAGVVGEETDSRGARFLVGDREAPDALINGEPSGWDGVTLGYRGFQVGTYAASTDSAHTSRPEPNAIQRATAWWSRVDAAFESDEETPVFERVTAKPVEIAGGVAEDGLSVEATIDAQFRIPPGETAASIRETVEGELGSGGEIEWREPTPPVMESPRTAVARAFRAAIRRRGGDPRSLRKTGTSDMNIYAGAWDRPMATYGPGDSALDHAPNERLDLGDLDRAVAVLEDVCETLQQ